jgi:hypothetical protein
MRNSTTILFCAITRWLMECANVRLPGDVSWNCSAVSFRRREAGRVEDPPIAKEIGLTRATAMMDLCGSCCR